MSEGRLNVSFVPAAEADFDRLAELRIAAMRESLERVGRFDPARARERLRSSFRPAQTYLLMAEAEAVGFYAVRTVADGLQLDHLYIRPDFQNRGIGGTVLTRICEEADRSGWPISVGALRQSASNRFYQRHGFVKTSESEWDIYYVRAPAQRPDTVPPAHPVSS